MIPNPISVSLKLDDGRELSIETGRMARQADGAAVVRLGNCMILATVVAKKEPKPGQSFFPLTVDYQEKFASAGRIPGSFFKREGRLSDYEVLISRLIDRALRPLFHEDYLCDGQFKINPGRSELAKADLEFLIAATEKNIMMVEGEANECSEDDLIKALEIAHDAIRIQIKAQKELWELAGSKTKRDYTKPEHNEELRAKVDSFAKEKVYEVSKAALSKHERSDKFDEIKEALLGQLRKDYNIAEEEELDKNV